MKDNYIVIDNEYLEIMITEQLADFGKRVLDYSTDKINEYLDFFREKQYGEKIKASFFTNRKDFLRRIEDIKDEEDNMPPNWATGCFYGGESQILIDINKPDDYFHILAHETFHLFFNKFVCEKFKIERIIWLDEALAGNFDDTTKRIIDNGYFDKLVNNYYHMELPSMDGFDFKDGLFITEQYNGYDLFKIIGRYLLEIYSKDELLDYISNYNKVIDDSKSILRKSLEYFYEKNNIANK